MALGRLAGLAGSILKYEEDVVAAPRRDSSLALGIQRIEPVDLQDPLVLGSLEQARRAMSNPRLQEILAVRTTIQHYLCGELIDRGYVHPPVYMLAGCTDPLNHWTYPARVNYYGEEVSVTQSLILQKILMVMLSGVRQVFWASPNIRMEMRIGRKEYKYTSEFMQVDFEKRDGTYEEMLQLISDLVRGLYRRLAETHADTIQRFRGSALPALTDPLAVIDVQDAKRRENLEDDDAVERWAGSRSQGRPFILSNLTREAYDCFEPDQGRFLNYDVVLPPAGENPHPIECLSGAERTRSIEDLERRMMDLNYPMAYFAPFFELFSSLDGNGGKIACAGAGFGVERLTYAILGLKDIHEVYPFPRMAEGRIAI